MSFCPFCHNGNLRRKSMAYLQWYGDDILIVNRMPALICNECNERIYDYDAVENLQQLIWSSPPSKARFLNRNRKAI